ncbi:MAG: hypothetical protein A2Z14_12045, partial [Chloroflexi bacterium RBG_16_48_8]
MGLHGGNWHSFLQYDEEQDQPEVSTNLLRRIAAHARPYWKGVAIILVAIVTTSILGLIPPLLIRDIIDHALPDKDFLRLNLLAIGMILIPLISGFLGVVQRYASAKIGEGIIFDLRCALYSHMQRMSLRFFTNTQVGELMSRLNNDVIGAQRAITGTVITLISNTVSLVAILVVMITLEWRLTLIGIAILPLFVFPAKRVGSVLRGIARDGLEANARMNAMMNETLNISGALLSKIFGRYSTNQERFIHRAGAVRDIGVRQAVIGRWFFLALSLVGAIGTALVFWIGGYFVLQGVFTIGTIVAFSAYLRELYGPLIAMTNARVDFVTSMVSFERVFEVIDLPVEITDRPDAIELIDVEGCVRFDEVSFSYLEANSAPIGLGEVRRFSRHATSVPVSVRKQKENEDEVDQGEDEAQEKIRWAIEDVSFEVLPGEVAALVGPSGAGKTTITYLLPRLYDPTKGSISIDGHDLRDVRIDSLSEH